MHRQKVRSRLVVLLVVLGVAMLAPLPLSAGPLSPSCAEAATGPSVAIVVDFGNVTGQGNPPGGVVTRCVPHYNDLSGAQALVDAGLTLRLGDGGMVCAINGYPATGCGEQTGTRRYLYWSYWKAKPGEDAWTYSAAGAGVEIRAGVSEGWRFVEGAGSPNDPQPGAAPDHVAICGPLQPETPSNPPPNTPSGGVPAAPDDPGVAQGGGDGGSAPPSTDGTGEVVADAPVDVAGAKAGAATTSTSRAANDDLALEDATPAAGTTNAGSIIGVVAVVVLIAALGAAAIVRSKRQPRSQ